jgi:hypothetical protein
VEVVSCVHCVSSMSMISLFLISDGSVTLGSVSVLERTLLDRVFDAGE